MFSIAFSLFLLMDPIGNLPYYISLLKGIEPKKQKRIIIREMLIALFIILFFNFMGEIFLDFLHVTTDTIQIAGGIILFLLALRMVFPKSKESFEIDLKGEPFIVPLAVPLIAGPSVLAAVMLYSHQAKSSLIMVGAISIAWATSLLIFIFVNSISKKLGSRGIIAMEKLMGLILVLISIQMFLSGVNSFIKPYLR